MLYGICSACTSFEISLICKGFFFVTKSDGGFNIPWCKFGGVRYMPCIVHSQAFLQILCYACIVMLAGSNIAEDVDVVKRESDISIAVFCIYRMYCATVVCPLPLIRRRAYGAMARQGASAWQPPFFISRCCIKKLAWQTQRLAKPKFFLRKNGGWRRGESNPCPGHC